MYFLEPSSSMVSDRDSGRTPLSNSGTIRSSTEKSTPEQCVRKAGNSSALPYGWYAIEAMS